MADHDIKGSVNEELDDKIASEFGSTVNEQRIFDKEDSVEDAIEELEKVLEDSKSNISMNNFNEDTRGVKRLRNRTSSESSERSYLVVDEVISSDRSLAGTDENSNPSYVVVDEFLDELESFEHDSDKDADVTVIHKSPKKCDEDDSVIFHDKVGCDSKSVIECYNCEKNDSKPDGSVVIGTPFISNKSISQLKSKTMMATSTPHRQISTNDENFDSNNSSIYVPPARSIIEKWRPSCLQRSQTNSTQNINQSIMDISAIECSTETPHKFIKQNTTTFSSGFGERREVAATNEFEEAFNKLYMTLFNDTDEMNLTSLNSNAKLKLYHDNIVKQHEEDNVKFNEVMSEISSISNKAFKTIDSTSDVESKNELSIIKEESEKSIDESEKTVIENSTMKNITDKKDDDSLNKENEVALNLRGVNFDKGSQRKTERKITKSDDDDDNDDDELLEKEILEVPVINGTKSITYLNNRELTLDEENALLVDDLDVISLECSDIDSNTPRLEAGDTSCSETMSAVPHPEGSVDSEPPPVTIPDSHQPLSSFSGALSSSELVNTELPSAPSASCEPVVSNEPVSSEPVPNEAVSVPSGEGGTVPAVKEESTVSNVFDRNAIFISDDPEENRDNNDPEWDHLRRLKNDKERYKALRERWHSVVIPDPNLDLTSQTYRQKRLERLNNRNRSTVKDSYNTENDACGSNTGFIGNSRKRPRSPDPCERNEGGPSKKRKLCTTLFEENIEALLRKLEFKRYCIHQEMDRELYSLAAKQEDEYQHCLAYTDNPIITNNMLEKLHHRQTAEVFNLRRKYETRIKTAEDETHEFVSALNAATDEVLTFHKFYHDLDSTNNNYNESTCSSMYLNDNQIKELVETEYMLELYSKFYN